MDVSWDDRRQTQPQGEFVQPLVVCPQASSGSETDCGEKMHIDVADAARKQRARLDEMQNLGVRRDSGGRQAEKRPQNTLALAKVAERDFADHERMPQTSPRSSNLASAGLAARR